MASYLWSSAPADACGNVCLPEHSNTTMLCEQPIFVLETKIRLGCKLYYVGVSIYVKHVNLSTITRISGLLLCVGLSSYLAYRLCLKLLRCESLAELLHKLKSELWHKSVRRTRCITRSKACSAVLSSSNSKDVHLFRPNDVPASSGVQYYSYKGKKVGKIDNKLLRQRFAAKRKRCSSSFDSVFDEIAPDPSASNQLFDRHNVYGASENSVAARDEGLNNLNAPRKSTSGPTPIWRTNALSDDDCRRSVGSPSWSVSSKSPPPISRHSVLKSHENSMDDASSVAGSSQCLSSTTNHQPSLAWDSICTPRSVDQSPALELTRSFSDYTRLNVAPTLTDSALYSFKSEGFENCELLRSDPDILIRRLLDSLRHVDARSDLVDVQRSSSPGPSEWSEISSSFAANFDLGNETIGRFHAAENLLEDTCRDVNHCAEDFSQSFDQKRLEWLSSVDYSRQIYCSVAMNCRSTSSSMISNQKGRRPGGGTVDPGRPCCSTTESADHFASKFHVARCSNCSSPCSDCFSSSSAACRQHRHPAYFQCFNCRASKYGRGPRSFSGEPSQDDIARAEKRRRRRSSISSGERYKLVDDHTINNSCYFNYHACAHSYHSNASDYSSYCSSSESESMCVVDNACNKNCCLRGGLSGLPLPSDSLLDRTLVCGGCTDGREHALQHSASHRGTISRRRNGRKKRKLHVKHASQNLASVLSADTHGDLSSSSFYDSCIFSTTTTDLKSSISSSSSSCVGRRDDQQHCWTSSGRFEPSLEPMVEDKNSSLDNKDGSLSRASSITRPESLQWDEYSPHSASDSFNDLNNNVGTDYLAAQKFLPAPSYLLWTVDTKSLVDYEVGSIVSLSDFVSAKYPYNEETHEVLRRLARHENLFSVKIMAESVDSLIESFLFHVQYSQISIFKSASFLELKEKLKIALDRHRNIFVKLCLPSDENLFNQLSGYLEVLWNYHNNVITLRSFNTDSFLSSPVGNETRQLLHVAVKILMILRALEVQDGKLFNNCDITPKRFYDELFNNSIDQFVAYLCRRTDCDSKYLEYEITLLADTFCISLEICRFSGSGHVFSDLYGSYYNANNSSGKMNDTAARQRACKLTLGRFFTADNSIEYFMPII